LKLQQRWVYPNGEVLSSERLIEEVNFS